MILNSRTQSAILTASFAVLAAFYAAAWFAPAVAGDHASGMNLVIARAFASGHGFVRDNLPEPVTETGVPPVFPAVLALFALISTQPQWLKLLPLGCAAGWLFLTRRLLLKMGASRGASLMLVGLAAAVPTVIYLSTNLLPQTMFGLLTTAAILMLLADRPLTCGLLAGLATLTMPTGAALIAACIVTLAVRGRFRSAVIFTAVAVLIAAPWFGWSLAHVTARGGLNSTAREATNILLSLPANEKLVVWTRNLVAFFDSPLQFLAGFTSVYSASFTAAVVLWCLWVRRQLMPDLFIAFYGLAAMLLIEPQKPLLAPVLPLMLWVGWRALGLIEVREAVAAGVLIAGGAALYGDAVRVPAVVRSGTFPQAEQAPNEWSEMRKLFGYIQTKTAPGTVLLANADATFYLNTGRKTVRGFVPNAYSLHYTEAGASVSPDQISTAIEEMQVSYVALTPDREMAEAASFHKAVDALERGGVLRPVEVEGLAPGYRLLHVASAGF